MNIYGFLHVKMSINVHEFDIFVKMRLVNFNFLQSVVVILRDYASLWLRSRGTPGDSTEMRAFVGEYLGTAELLNRTKPKEDKSRLPDKVETMVIYNEELKEVEGTLPQSLLELWKLEEAAKKGTSDTERIEQLRKIAMSCDELEAHCEGAACRHLAEY